MSQPLRALGLQPSLPRMLEQSTARAGTRAGRVPTLVPAVAGGMTGEIHFRGGLQVCAPVRTHAAPLAEPLPPATVSLVKAVSAGLLVLAIAVMIARAFLTWVNHSTPAGIRWITSMDSDRVRAIHGALPRLAAKDQPAAFMVGPSPVFYGFIPDAFDEVMRTRGAPVVSYNLGVLGNIPATDRLIVRRLGEAFAAEGRRPRLILLSFAPLAATPGFLQGRTRSHLRKQAILSTPSELLALFLADPHAATELVAPQLLGGIGAADSNAMLGKRIFRAPKWWFLSPDWQPGEWEQQSARVNQGYAPQLGKFDQATRGVFNPLIGNTLADYDRMADLAFTEQNLRKQQGFWGSTDFENVPIDPERLETFVLMVGEAQGIADAVVVVVPPNSEHVQPGAVGRESIAAALAEIAARTGVPIVDLCDTPGFDQADFVDFTHLKHDTGAPKFSRMVADSVAPILAAQET